MHVGTIASSDPQLAGSVFQDVRIADFSAAGADDYNGFCPRLAVVFREGQRQFKALPTDVHALVVAELITPAGTADGLFSFQSQAAPYQGQSPTCQADQVARCVARVNLAWPIARQDSPLSLEYALQK